MAHFAILDDNNTVTDVIVIGNGDLHDDHGEECEEKGLHMCRHIFQDQTVKAVQTSYNANFRNKYAAIGDTYLEEHDVFISSQPYPSHTLNLDTFLWECPVPKPEDPPKNYIYTWDEENVNWKLFDVRLPLVEVTNEKFRSALTLQEKILWDNPETNPDSKKVIIVTAKMDLPTYLYRDKNNELLDLLVNTGIFTRERMDEIIDDLLTLPPPPPII